MFERKVINLDFFGLYNPLPKRVQTKHGGNEQLQVEYSGRMTAREEVAWVCADDDNDRKRVKRGGKVGGGSDLGLRCSATVIMPGKLSSLYFCLHLEASLLEENM